MAGDLNERAGKALAGRGRPGMLFIDYDGARLRIVGDGERPGFIVEGGIADAMNPVQVGYASARAVPDMSDPATRGAYLDVVREAWGDPGLHLRPDSDGWGVFLGNGASVWVPGPIGPDDDPELVDLRAATEAEALVAALEAAPKPAASPEPA